MQRAESTGRFGICPARRCALQPGWQLRAKSLRIAGPRALLRRFRQGALQRGVLLAGQRHQSGRWRGPSSGAGFCRIRCRLRGQREVDHHAGSQTRRRGRGLRGIGLAAVVRQGFAAFGGRRCRLQGASGLQRERGGGVACGGIRCWVLRVVRLGLCFCVCRASSRWFLRWALHVRPAWRTVASTALCRLRLPGTRQGVGKAWRGLGLRRCRSSGRRLFWRRGSGRGRERNDQRHGGGSSNDMPIQSKTCASVFSAGDS